MKNNKIELIFFHIFKCGGTTFNWLLQENFPDKVIYAESPLKTKKYLAKETLKENLNKLMKEKEIKAISSHNISASCFDMGEIAFAILRNPYKRNWSAYNFQKNEINDTSYENYLIKNSNFQFKVLTKGIKKNNKNKLIIDLLDNFKFGILERFEESMLCLEWAFQKRGLNLDLSYANNFNTQIYGQSIILNNLEKINQKMKVFYELDLLLYEKANNKLDSEIEKIPNFEKKFTEFKLRCRNLQELKYKGKREKYGQGPDSFFFMN